MSTFEKATRHKFRFDSPQGLLDVEQLWELPLSSEKKNVANLDDIARGLNKKIKEQSSDESFVKPESGKEDTTTPVMFEVVKNIIKVRLEENDVRLRARETREKKQLILSIISKKQNEKLEGTSIEELQKMVEAL
jgi:hypothetical protein